MGARDVEGGRQRQVAGEGLMLSHPIKVTEAELRVTDQHMLKQFQAEGRDPDYVEFFQDYSEKWPNAKVYRDRRTNERIAKIGFGKRVIAGKRVSRVWSPDKEGNWVGGWNAFTVKVDAKTGRTTIASGGEEREWNPKVRLDGEQVKFSGAKVKTRASSSGQDRPCLLEFDYGLCKRRLYLDHGALREWYVFDAAPPGEVEIESSYDDPPVGWDVYQTAEDADGKPVDGVELGKKKVLHPEDFEGRPLPLWIDDSTNFSMDTAGSAVVYRSDSSFYNNRTETSADGHYHPSTYMPVEVNEDGGLFEIVRLALRIGTAGLNDAATISAATFNAYLYSNTDDSTWGEDVRIFYVTDTADPFDNGTYDYGYWSYAADAAVNCDANGWKAFSLNSTGRAQISKTGETRLGLRNRIDYQNEEPTSGQSNRQYFRGPTYSDSSYRPYFTVVYTVPAVEKTKTFTLDALLQALGKTKTFALDAMIQAPNQTKTFTADALIQGLATKTFTLDAMIQELNKTKTFTLDAVISWLPTETFTIDAMIQDLLTKTFTLDAMIQALGRTETFTVDAIIMALQAANMTVDAMIQGLQTKTFTIDGLIQALNQTKTFAVDAMLQAEGTKTFAMDAILQETLSKTLDIDAIIQGEQTETFDIDAIIQALDQVKTFTVDAMLQAEGTKTFSADALLQGLQSVSATMDALIKGTATKTFTIDSVLQGESSVSITADAMLQGTNTAALLFDALVQGAGSVTLTIDAVLLHLTYVQGDIFEGRKSGDAFSGRLSGDAFSGRLSGDAFGGNQDGDLFGGITEARLHGEGRRE